MTEFDYLYDELLRKILREGVEVENRTGVNTIKVPSHTFEFNIEKEFPILTTKQMFYRQAIIEMLWIWQMGSNNVLDLHDRNVHIWDEWMVDQDGIYRIYEPSTEQYDPDKEVVVLDPLSAPLDNLNAKLNPKLDENGNVMTAKSMINGKNIKKAKYYGIEYANTIGTAYGYKDSDEYNELDSNIRIIDMIFNPTKPELVLNPDINDFFLFDNSKDLKDIKIKNYKHMGKIKFPITQ